MFHKVATLALATQCLGNERRNFILMMCLYPDLGSASDWLDFSFNQSEALPMQDLGRAMSSVWNFYARYSDVVLGGLKWRPRETSAVFSG